MMRISRALLAAFEPLETRRFVERTVLRLREYFEETASTSDEELSALVRLGMARAEEHGIWSGENVALYTGMMVYLGADFDRDGERPWAAEILGQREVDATTRMAWLYARAGESAPGAPSGAAGSRALSHATSGRAGNPSAPPENPNAGQG